MYFPDETDPPVPAGARLNEIIHLQLESSSVTYPDAEVREGAAGNHSACALAAVGEKSHQLLPCNCFTFLIVLMMVLSPSWDANLVGER